MTKASVFNLSSKLKKTFIHIPYVLSIIRSQIKGIVRKFTIDFFFPFFRSISFVVSLTLSHSFLLFCFCYLLFRSSMWVASYNFNAFFKHMFLDKRRYIQRRERMIRWADYEHIYIGTITVIYDNRSIPKQKL